MLLATGVAASSTDEGVIRLRVAPPAAATDLESAPDPVTSFRDPRRGFDYDAFQARLESLWFQRKTLLADNRDADVAEQSRMIRSFCSEEGVHRLEALSGALIAEAARFTEQGHYERAFASLDLANLFDPDRPEVHRARAALLWRSGGTRLAAVLEWGAAIRAAALRATKDLSLFNQIALVLVVAWLGCLLVFAVLMVLRYQTPFRHEVREWVEHVANERWAGAAAWAALFLPAVVWVGAGWLVLYWLLITFRFMRRGEKLAAVSLLLGTALALPAYRMAVSVYGMTADPVARTTLASADGEYDPERILRLRQLVESYPQDPVYRFLLAGLYKNGRYFEEAFEEYKRALALDPELEQAYINVGNIFYTTGQYREAIAQYREALALEPRSPLPLFNMHLAQSEAFRFQEAEETLRQARAIDARWTAELFARARERSERPTVLDASLQTSSVWQAALTGGRSRALFEAATTDTFRRLPQHLLNPLSLAALATLLGCGLALLFGGRHAPARCCIRCGRPFCHYCKSDRQGQEYCSQCHHLFVLGDGLAPETKTRKLYEVSRHDRVRRRSRRLVSLLLPGAAQLLRGRAGRGVLLVLAWLAALVAWRPALLYPTEWLTGVDFGLQLIQPRAVPALYTVNVSSLLAFGAMVLVWVAANAWHLKGREA